MITASAPSGHRRARHNLDRLAWSDCGGENLARTHFPDDAQIAGQIRRAHSESIPGRAMKGGIIPVGGDFFCQNARRRIEHRNLLDRYARAHLTQHAFAGLLETECH